VPAAAAGCSTVGFLVIKRFLTVGCAAVVRSSLSSDSRTAASGRLTAEDAIQERLVATGNTVDW
jgi:hypothetical protein